MMLIIKDKEALHELIGYFRSEGLLNQESSSIDLENPDYETLKLIITQCYDNFSKSDDKNHKMRDSYSPLDTISNKKYDFSSNKITSEKIIPNSAFRTTAASSNNWMTETKTSSGKLRFTMDSSTPQLESYPDVMVPHHQHEKIEKINEILVFPKNVKNDHFYKSVMRGYYLKTTALKPNSENLKFSNQKNNLERKKAISKVKQWQSTTNLNQIDVNSIPLSKIRKVKKWLIEILFCKSNTKFSNLHITSCNGGFLFDLINHLERVSILKGKNFENITSVKLNY